ncbi:hypothetical protein HDU67_002447 [Dinochytrium kinnereticum]|nr:hypothetical protein HDU67_002447 [Dinochytrium kinnereticum]
MTSNPFIDGRDQTTPPDLSSPGGSASLGISPGGVKRLAMAFGGAASAQGPSTARERGSRDLGLPSPRRLLHSGESDADLSPPAKDQLLSSLAGQTSPPSFRKFRYSVGNGGGIINSSESLKNRRSRSFGDDLDNDLNPFEDDVVEVSNAEESLTDSEKPSTPKTIPIPSRRPPMHQSVSLPFVLKDSKSSPNYGSQPVLSLSHESFYEESNDLVNPFESQQESLTPPTSYLAPNMPVPERGQSLNHEAMIKPPLPRRPLSPLVSPNPNFDVVKPPLPSRPTALSQATPLAPPRYDSATPPPIPSRPQISRNNDTPKKETVIAPDFSGPVNRNPPEPDFLATREVSHKGYVRCWAVSGFCICTAGQQNLRIYYTPTDDGRFLWAGLENGDIACVDTVNGSIIDRKSVHSVAITHMIRYRGSIWSLDENGSLKIWEPDQTGTIVLGSRPRSLRIGSRQEKALIVNGKLWTSSGKTIEIYNPEETSSIFQQKIDVGSITVGNLPVANVTALTTSADSSRVISGHKDGVIIVWDSSSYSKIALVKASSYSIASLLYLPNEYLWVGYQIGKVHVFDVSNDSWGVIKYFLAHQAAVSDLYLDGKIYFSSGQMHVTSLSRIDKGDSSIKFWDGSLQRDWIDAYVRQYESDFSAYRNVSLFVGSWNIDANKPEALDTRPASENTLYQWFTKIKANPPEIIVINFQELVDLESKKVNAKQMLLDATAKRTGKGHDHRFQLWHDRILRSLREQLGGVYRDLQSQQLVGLFQCVFLLEQEVSRCKVVTSARVKTGLGGFHGNKGGIATRLVLDDSSFCFLNCHLAAHQNQVEARNSDALSIRDSMSFNPCNNLQDYVFTGGGDGSIILDHENVVIAGGGSDYFDVISAIFKSINLNIPEDLNYRIELPRDKVIEAVERNNLRFLLEHDQLSKQRFTNFNFGFRGFSEGDIDFPPTFKYDINSQQYDTSEKKRVPSWCDRILWRGNFTQKSYERVESMISDHRPVMATFTVPVKQIQPSKLEQVKSRGCGRLQVFLTKSQKMHLEALEAICGEHETR